MLTVKCSDAELIAKSIGRPHGTVYKRKGVVGYWSTFSYPASTSSTSAESSPKGNNEYVLTRGVVPGTYNPDAMLSHIRILVDEHMRPFTPSTWDNNSDNVVSKTLVVQKSTTKLALSAASQTQKEAESLRADSESSETQHLQGEAEWNVHVEFLCTGMSWEIAITAATELFPDEFETSQTDPTIDGGAVAYDISITFLGNFPELWNRLRLFLYLIDGETHLGAAFDDGMIDSFCKATSINRAKIVTGADLWNYFAA